MRRRGKVNRSLHEKMFSRLFYFILLGVRKWWLRKSLQWLRRNFYDHPEMWSCLWLKETSSKNAAETSFTIEPTHQWNTAVTHSPFLYCRNDDVWNTVFNDVSHRKQKLEKVTKFVMLAVESKRRKRLICIFLAAVLIFDRFPVLGILEAIPEYKSGEPQILFMFPLNDSHSTVLVQHEIYILCNFLHRLVASYFYMFVSFDVFPSEHKSHTASLTSSTYPTSNVVVRMIMNSSKRKKREHKNY